SDLDNVITYRLTRKLYPKEGFTVLVGFEKGKVIPPSFFKKLRYFFNDNRDIFIGVLGILAALIYYLVAWHYIGRDPKSGAIFPQWEAPANLSAAEARYLHRMSYDRKAFSSLIVEMAIKGILEIDHSKKGGTYTLIRKEYKEPLSPLEEKVVNSFF